MADEYNGRDDEKFIRIEKWTDESVKPRGWNNLAEVGSLGGFTAKDVEELWWFDDYALAGEAVGDVFEVDIAQVIHDRIYIDTVRVRKVRDARGVSEDVAGVGGDIETEGMIVEIMSDWSPC